MSGYALGFGHRFLLWTRGNMITKRGLEIVNAIWSSWGFTQIAKHRKRKLVSRFGERTDQTPFVLMVLGGLGTEQAKNQLCLQCLDIQSSVNCPGTLSQDEHSRKAALEIYRTLDSALGTFSCR